MVEVYDLEERTISEILLLAANPPGLEDRLIPEGESIESYLDHKEAAIVYDIIREKCVNTLNQRTAILKVLDDAAFANHHPDPETKQAFENQEALIDHIIENLWGDVYRQVEGMERRHRRSLGEKVDRIWERSTTLRRASDWSDPKKLRGFKANERNRKISVSIEHYENGGKKTPLVRQKAEKLPYSVGDKFRREIEKALGGTQTMETVSEKVRDFVKGMIVTVYGGHDTGSFANPNLDQGPQTDLQRNIRVALQDPRLVEIDSKNYYHKPEKPINMVRSYVKLSDAFLSSLNSSENEIIRHPHVYSGREVMSFVTIDARNYFTYFLGPWSHARSKMHGHKGSVHKDSEELELTREEKKIAEECGKRVEKVYQHATVLRSAG